MISIPKSGSCVKSGPISYFLGSKINQGADGIVYHLLNSDKVIKITTISDRLSKDKNTIIDADISYHLVQRSLEYLLKFNPKPYAKLFDYHHINSLIKNGQKHIIYLSVLEKLLELSDDEKKVFYTLSTENFKNSQLEIILRDLNRGLDFPVDRVILFSNHLENCKLKQLDFRFQNIMKDLEGNFKLIDFDRTEIKG